MTFLQFPSPETPALPSFAVEIPDQWARVITPDTILSARAPAVDGEFQSNVIVTWARYGEPITLQTASEVVLESYAQREQAEFIGVGEESLEGTPAWLCEVGYVHPSAGTIVQANTIVIQQQGDVYDVLHVVASCGAARVHDEFQAVRSTARSIRLDA